MVQLDPLRGMELTAAREERLERPPLKLVICQVRYPRKLGVRDIDVGLAIQRALHGGPEVWRLQEAQPQVMLSLAISPGEGAAALPTPVEAQPGWQLTAEDGTWMVTLYPQSAALQTTNYVTWEHFSTRLQFLLAAVQDAVRPSAEERLGLRYVNQLEGLDVTAPADWGRWISPSVLGVPLNESIGPGVVVSQQQVDLRVQGGLYATLRHGILRDENSRQSYMIDIDAYRIGLRSFDTVAIMADVERENQLARMLFQRVITDEAYTRFRGEV